MELSDIAKHWLALHETLGLGAPITDEAHYEQTLAVVDQLFDAVAADPAHPLGGLVEILADRIREYEHRVHPWPDTSTPASVLASLMEEHGLRQSGSPCRWRCWPADFPPLLAARAADLPSAACWFVGAIKRGAGDGG